MEIRRKFLETLSSSLYHLLDDRILCDTVIKTNNGKIWAHSSILAAVSPSMLSTFVDMSGRSARIQRFKIDLSGSDLTSVKIALRYMYTGIIVIPENYPETDELSKVFTICEKLGVDLSRLNGSTVMFEDKKLPLDFLNDEKCNVFEVMSDSVVSNKEKCIPARNIDKCSKIWGDKVNIECFLDSNSTSKIPNLADESECLIQVTNHPEINSANNWTDFIENNAITESSHTEFLTHNNDTTGTEKIQNCKINNTVAENSEKHKLVSSLIVCDKSSKDRKCFKKHEERRIHGRMHECMNCGKSYEHKSSLLQHSLTHLEQKPYLCELCGKGFTLAVTLKRHIMARHSEHRSFCCGICGKGFIRDCTLKQHMHKHLGLKSDYCPTCGIAFSNRSNLNRHMQIHNGLKFNSCSLCDKSFYRKENLQKHMQKHARLSKKSSKHHMCTVCHRNFYSEKMLANHMPSHLDQKSYVCDVCNRGFTTLRCLKQHSSVHKEKLHTCATCNKKFSSEKYLSQHIKQSHSVSSW